MLDITTLSSEDEEKRRSNSGLVTKISQAVRDKNRVNIYIDNEYFCSLDISQVVDFHLKENMRLNEEELQQLKTASDFGKFYACALRYVFVRPRSSKEIRDYLKRKTLSRKVRVKNNKTADEKLKNARNAVAGAIRNLDPKITASRNLDVVFYDIVKIQDENLLKTQQQVNDFLKDNYFLTGKLFEVANSAKQIEENIEKVDKVKSKLDILIDGLVIKLNNINLRDEVGFTSKFPKWAIAYKFAPQELTATLEQVEWNVGRTGKITPTAIISPVELAGATVSRATLNNFDDIKKKKVKLNSLVFVRRSNEVIPEILGLAQDTENSKEIEKPKFCPCCKTPVAEVGPNIFCTNPNCLEKVVEKLTYFASRNCMNIEGLSGKIIELLNSKNLVKNFSDFYILTHNDFVGLEGFKDKKINNILF